MRPSNPLRPAVLVAADVAVCIALWPEVARTWAWLRAPRQWVAAAGWDLAATHLAAAALWCALVWLGVGLAAALAASLPGAVGSAATAVARVALPRIALRVVAGTIGAGTVLAPTAAHAADPPPVMPMSTPTPAVAAPTLPGLGTVIGSPAPAPGRPPAAQPSPDAGSTVVVRPGDSLWSIAVAALPAGAPQHRIAFAVAECYRANTAVIGSDPDLLRPGQIIRLPWERA